MHTCNARCKAILHERLLKHPCPPIWNSMTFGEQREWSRYEHRKASQEILDEKRPAWTRPLLRTFKFLFGNKQFERVLDETPHTCSECGKDYE